MTYTNTVNYKINYDITYLINRAYVELNKVKNKNKSTFIKPEIITHNRKTYITNFIKFCESINREPNSVKKYLETELSIQTSIIGESNFDDEKSGLKIDVLLRPNIVFNAITSYMKEFVLCKHCKARTIIEKRDKLTYMVCNNCKSESTIKL
jgi:translation initiation factor 2 beta subunit (eIF-2beta)/eIF-5